MNGRLEVELAREPEASESRVQGLADRLLVVPCECTVRGGSIICPEVTLIRGNGELPLVAFKSDVCWIGDVGGD